MRVNMGWLSAEKFRNTYKAKIIVKLILKFLEILECVNSLKLLSDSFFLFSVTAFTVLFI